MKNALAVILAGVSAYALSFAADLLFGAILRIYPRGTTMLPMFVWWFIAMITWLVAIALARKRFLAIPFVLITCIACFGGIVGKRYDFAVAGVMAFASVLVWLLTGIASTPPIKKPANR